MSELTLKQYIQSLWVACGRPPSRHLAMKTGLSHQTTNAVVRRAGGSWNTIELVVKAMHGDVEQAGRLWDAERATVCGPRDILEAEFKDLLTEWVDHDGACFALGRAVGLFPAGGFKEFQTLKHVFWSSNQLGDLLTDMLDLLVNAGLVQRSEDRDQYRWQSDAQFRQHVLMHSKGR